MNNRELDAKVATEVRGWRWPEDRCEWCGWTYDEDGIGCLPNDCSQRPMPKVKQSTDYPHYSTDIAAAMLVVEKLREMGYTTLRLSTGGNLGDRWQCHCADKWRQISREGDKDYFANADTLPLAICLAALKAVEEE